jgi:hypothetical protein
MDYFDDDDILEDAGGEYETYYFTDTTTPGDLSGGCSIGLLAPISVLIIGCLLVVGWISVAPSDRLSRAIASQGPAAVQSALVDMPGQGDSSDDEASGKLARLFTPEVRYWEREILAWAKANQLDPNLVATVMQIESCGDPKATSSAGASGLFQVMPFHFKTGENAYDPDTNAKRGLAYLARALDARSGDARLALASYNAGITGGGRPEDQWPAETKRYAYWGEGIYSDASDGKKRSERLDEWLNAGGASLCNQARKRLGINP